MNRDELRKLATEYNIKGRSKMTVSELRAALEAEGCDLETASENTGIRGSQAELDKARAESAKHDIDRSTKPGVMGLHYQGRALGLKHYQAMGLTRQAPELLPYDPERDGPQYLPNSERVQKYTRQNVAQLGMDVNWRKSGDPTRPKLTHRQMRRVRKNANKHGESFRYMYDAAGNNVTTPVSGYSLLARTPDGLGIFYQFSK